VKKRELYSHVVTVGNVDSIQADTWLLDINASTIEHAFLDYGYHGCGLWYLRWVISDADEFTG